MTESPASLIVSPVDDKEVISPLKQTTLYWLFVSLLAVVAAIKPLLIDTLDPDIFWHIRTAQRLLSEGIGPLIDDFSFSSVADPWTPYSWLAEIAMYKIWLLGGYRATLAAHGLMLISIVGAMGAIAFESVEPYKGQNTTNAAIATGSGIPFVIPFLSFRPITFSILILAIIYWLLIRDRRMDGTARSVWLAIPLMVLGINVHFFSLVALAWVAVRIISDVVNLKAASNVSEKIVRRNRRNYLLFAWMLVAACLTPMLPGMIRSILHYALEDPMALELVEMRSIPKLGMYGLVLSSLMMVWLSLLGRAYRQLSLIEWLWISFLLIITILHVRFAPVLALSILPYITRSASGARVIQDNEKRITKFIAGLIILAAAWWIAIFPSADQKMEQWANRRVPLTIGYPNEAVDFVLDNIQPRHYKIINEFAWGGYIGWRLGDNYKVFLDGRTQVYSPEFWRSTYVAAGGRLLKLLSGVDADAAILPSRGSLLQGPLKSLGWHVCHSDPLAIVMLPPGMTLPQCTSN